MKYVIKDYPLEGECNFAASSMNHFSSCESSAANRMARAVGKGPEMEAWLFNNQTRLQTDAQKYLDLRQIPTPPYFAPYEQPNPFFGTGNAFAPPRRLYVSLAAQF